MNSNKIAIRLISIIIFWVCMAALSLVLVKDIVESRADAYADARVNFERPVGLDSSKLIARQDSIGVLKWEYRRYYLDSVGYIPLVKIPGLNKIYTYRFCRDHALKPGIKLSGKLNMVVGVDEGDFLRARSGANSDSAFNVAIDEAKNVKPASSRAFFTSFQQAYERLNTEGKLADIFCKTDAYFGKINCNASNNEVINVLSKDLDAESIEAFNVIKARVDRVGAVSPDVTRSAETGRIMLNLPGVDNPLRVRKVLLRRAHLQFFNTYETSEVLMYLGDANTALRKLVTNTVKPIAAPAGHRPAHTESDPLAALLDTSSTNDVDTAGNNELVATHDNAVSDDPLFSVLYPNMSAQGGGSYAIGEGPCVARAFGKDTAIINTMLSLPGIKAIFPRDLKLLWGARPEEPASRNVYGLYAIKQDPSKPEGPVSGDDITEAFADKDNYGLPEVQITMSKFGAVNWEHMTESAANSNLNGKPFNRCIAVVIDDHVFSAPRVMQKITAGRSVITGIDDKLEAEDLATVIQSFRLKDNVRVVDYKFTAPLGQQSGNPAWIWLIMAVVTAIFAFVFKRTL